MIYFIIYLFFKEMKYDEESENEMLWQSKMKQLEKIEDAKMRANRLGE